jgi:hypothetical protein
MPTNAQFLIIGVIAGLGIISFILWWLIQVEKEQKEGVNKWP